MQRIKSRTAHDQPLTLLRPLLEGRRRDVTLLTVHRQQLVGFDGSPQGTVKSHFIEPHQLQPIVSD